MLGRMQILKGGSPMRKPLIAGNWKMNGLRADLAELTAMGKGFSASMKARCDLLICTPATLLHTAAITAIGTGIAVGGQDCHARQNGAHTGDISAAMLADAGASAVILGHSERRADHGERDADVRAKAEAAHAAGLHAILCVGETRAEREGGRANAVVRRQLRGSIPQGMDAATLTIAYEPVWAIGTGLTPTLDDIQAMHADIRKTLRSIFAKGEAEKMRILYGGSVKPSNAKDILTLPDVDGALVGGASLKATDFLAIAEAV